MWQTSTHAHTNKIGSLHSLRSAFFNAWSMNPLTHTQTEFPPTAFCSYCIHTRTHTRRRALHRLRYRGRYHNMLCVDRTLDSSASTTYVFLSHVIEDSRPFDFKRCLSHVRRNFTSAYTGAEIISCYLVLFCIGNLTKISSFNNMTV